jgi:hypothetical protein
MKITSTMIATTTPMTIAIMNLVFEEFEEGVGQPLALQRNWFPDVLHPHIRNKMSNYIVKFF